MGDENGRRLYLVDHDLRGLSPAQLVSVHRVLGEAVRREVRRAPRSGMGHQMNRLLADQPTSPAPERAGDQPIPRSEP